MKENFPRLYALQVDREARIGDRVLWVDGEQQWRWNWRRELRAREVSEFTKFLNLLKHVELQKNKEDGWEWNLNNKDSFSVVSLSTTREDYILKKHQDQHSTPWNSILLRRLTSLRGVHSLTDYLHVCSQPSEEYHWNQSAVQGVETCWKGRIIV